MRLWIQFGLFMILFIEGSAHGQSPAPPAPVPPPVSAAPPQPRTSAPPTPPSALFFYYCQRPNAYFPTIDHCDEGWIAVPAGPAVPVGPVWFEPRRPPTDETVKSQPTAISLEMLGRALAYSFDLDRTVSPHLTLGVGFSSWRTGSWWQDYSASVTVVPVYANYYFSPHPSRVFFSAGVDWIHVSAAGNRYNIFENSGLAGVLGGGYEMRDISGFLVRLGGFLIFGRSAELSPMASFGYAF